MFSYNKKVTEETAFQHELCLLISILENIHYQVERIPNIDFHSMLLVHDQFRISIQVVEHRTNEKSIYVNIRIRVNMVKSEARLAEESESPLGERQLDEVYRNRAYRYYISKDKISSAKKRFKC